MDLRYTSLVERHVPAMARCLQDHSPLIRRHAQALISQLLLQVRPSPHTFHSMSLRQVAM